MHGQYDFDTSLSHEATVLQLICEKNPCQTNEVGTTKDGTEHTIIPKVIIEAGVWLVLWIQQRVAVETSRLSPFDDRYGVQTDNASVHICKPIARSL